MLTIDSREPRSMIRLFAKIWNVAPKVKMQETDIVTEYFVVERKSVADMLHSSRGRIFDEIDRMIQYFPERLHILWIHGSIKELIDKLRDEIGFVPRIDVLYGALASIFVRYGVLIIWTVTEVEGVLLLKKIYDKIKEGKLGKPRVRSLVKASDRRVQMLCTMFRISRPTAEYLLLRHKTLRDAVLFMLNATDEELLKVEGIGPKTLKRLRFLFNEVWR